MVVPDLAINPAQKRQQVELSLAGVAASGKRCVDKIEEVEEIEYDEVEECHHSYDKKCHTTYQTEYESQQEEECDDNFHKTCEVTEDFVLNTYFKYSPLRSPTHPMPPTLLLPSV